MSETVINPQTRPVIDNSPARLEAREAIRRGCRSILREAVEIKAITLETLRRMRESFTSEDGAERARAEAQAVTALTKAYAESVEIIRIERGKPLPGSRRPLPEQPKARKSKPANKPPSFKPVTPETPANPTV